MRSLALTIALAFTLALQGQLKSPDSYGDLQQWLGNVAPLTSCFGGNLSCGQTVTGRVSVDSCESGGKYAVGYSFNGTAGNRVTLSGFSAQFPASILLVDGRQGNSTLYARDDKFVTGSTAVISNFTLPYTGPYLVFITPDIPNTFGDYAVTLSCQSSNTGACVTSATTACLLNDRFRVSVAYVNQFANPPAPGTLLGTKLLAGSQNPDVATFGISGALAVEVVVRIQDARPFGLNRFDVYYGGLTDLEYTVSVTDTQKGTTKTFRNPPGVVGGGVDRSTFTAN